jgi:PPK2 family polyphosphate:nucleotide phosphotransferase
MKIKSPYLVKPHTKVRLSKLSTNDHDGIPDSAAADKALEAHRGELARIQEVFYASQSKALLIVLQGMDTAGKDGTISHIFSGINPQGCQVASFKVPTSLELRHDFLWRCHQHVPPRGMIGIFNRSHYEDVLTTVVHGNINRKQARQRMDDINAWEQTLVDNNVVILKFFLHISQSEQTQRLQDRIDTRDKHWKLSPSDFAERRFWNQYAAAYEDVLSRTSHKHAPWYVIPSDHKWFRNVAISHILCQTLRGLKLRYPKPTFDPTGLNLRDESIDAAAKKVLARVNKGVKDVEADSMTHGSTKS